MKINTWKDYWETLKENPLIFRIEAEDYVARLKKLVNLMPEWQVLDFGCGFGYLATTLAPEVKEVLIWDEAENMRNKARSNTAQHKNVKCLDSWDRIKSDHQSGFDLIIVNSVMQYMPLNEYPAWLSQWKELLKAQGIILISDLIPYSLNLVLEFFSLLPFGFRNRFLLRALKEARKELKGYIKIKENFTLTRIRRLDLKKMAEEKGLNLKLAPQNLTYRSQRITAIFSIQ